MALCAASLGFVPPASADPTDEDPSGPSADPDVVAGKKAIDDKKWADAIKALSSAALRDTRNADIQNYLGYAYRNAGQMDQAFAHYERALKLNPRHRGAHEYVGEAYLIVGQASAGRGASESVASDLPVALRRARRLEGEGRSLPARGTQTVVPVPSRRHGGLGPTSQSTVAVVLRPVSTWLPNRVVLVLGSLSADYPFARCDKWSSCRPRHGPEGRCQHFASAQTHRPRRPLKEIWR